MTDVRFLYVVCSSLDEATSIGRSLVERRLVACVNILPNMTSIYRWKGAIESSTEVVMIAKTRLENVESLIATIPELHSYETPCVVSLVVDAGSDHFLNWVDAESKPD